MSRIRFNMRRHTAGGGGDIPPPGDVLTGADFTYLGMFAGPPGGHPVSNPTISRGAMTGRRVDGQLQLLIQGGQTSYYPVYALTPPAALHATYEAATSAGPSGRGTVVADWGPYIYGVDAGEIDETHWTTGGTSLPMDVSLGLLYIDGKLLYNFQNSYNTSNFKDRCIGMATLDSTSAATKYGPWRTSASPVAVGSYFIDFPQDIADLYFEGRRIGVASTAISGVGAAPFGISFYTMDIPSTSLPASDYADEEDIAITTTVVARYDSTHRCDLTFLGLQRTICGWADPGNHSVTTAPVSAGTTSIPVADTTLYAQPGSISQSAGFPFYAWTNSTSSGFFTYTDRSTTSGPGNLTGVPTSGFGATGDIADGTAIILGNYDNGRGGVIKPIDDTWGPVPADNPGDLAVYYDYPGTIIYIRTSGGKHGVLFLCALVEKVTGVDPYEPDGIAHTWYGAPFICPHGQTASVQTPTPGPKATSTVGYFFVYDIADLAAVQDGDLAIADLLPTSTFKLSDITTLATSINGAYFDDVDQKLYMCSGAQDLHSVNSSFPLPIVHVFGVG